MTKFVIFCYKSKLKQILIDFKNYLQNKFLQKHPSRFYYLLFLLHNQSLFKPEMQSTLSSKPQPKSIQKLVKITGIYMEQNSPDNPFGPNYKELPLSTKITYKYSMMKEFIKIRPEDNFHKQVEEQRFLGTLILGFVGGYFIAEIPRMIYSQMKKRLVNRGWVTILSTCTFSSFGYLKAHQRYYEQVPKRFLDRYLKQAIQNGFQDYQVSSNQKPNFNSQT